MIPLGGGNGRELEVSPRCSIETRPMDFEISIQPFEWWRRTFGLDCGNPISALRPGLWGGDPLWLGVSADCGPRDRRM
jgi:hypothetical protein